MIVIDAMESVLGAIATGLIVIDAMESVPGAIATGLIRQNGDDSAYLCENLCDLCGLISSRVNVQETFTAKNAKDLAKARRGKLWTMAAKDL